MEAIYAESTFLEMKLRFQFFEKLLHTFPNKVSSDD